MAMARSLCGYILSQAASFSASSAPGPVRADLADSSSRAGSGCSWSGGTIRSCPGSSDLGKESRSDPTHLDGVDELNLLKVRHHTLREQLHRMEDRLLWHRTPVKHQEQMSQPHGVVLLYLLEASCRISKD